MNPLVFTALAFLIFGTQYKKVNSDEVCGGCLILTPHIRNGNAMLARDLSAVDPKHFLGTISHTGFITVKEKYGSNLFFWFFPGTTRLETTPWIIWLQGGPGFSSLFGLFELIGPLSVDNGEVKLKNITWANDFSILFVDNPVGAGFSYTAHEDGYPDNEDDVSEQLLELLQQFLEMFPELKKAPLFLAGESYAGKYVPALGIQIHKQNKGKNRINLRGVVIGSDMIEPRSLMDYSDLCAALGLLEYNEVATVRDLEQTTVRLIDEGTMVEASNKFNETIEYIKKHSGVSIYNFNKSLRPVTKPPGFETFVNSPDIRESIHVGNTTFHFNNQVVYQKMLPDIMNTTKPLVEELLEHYGVKCWHGQEDIIMAYSLAINTYKELKWSRRQEYIDAPRIHVRDSEIGDIVAFKKSGGNFTEVMVRRAGHMLPADQPEVAKFLLDTFVNEYK